MRRSVVVMMAVLMVGTAMASLGVGGTAQGQEVPDPAFVEQVPGAPCKPESAFEKKGWKLSASHQAGDKCKRIQFTFGPITVKPGQNDVLIGPVTIEKPAYDGIHHALPAGPRRRRPARPPRSTSSTCTTRRG